MTVIRLWLPIHYRAVWINIARTIEILGNKCISFAYYHQVRIGAANVGVGGFAEIAMFALRAPQGDDVITCKLSFRYSLPQKSPSIRSKRKNRRSAPVKVSQVLPELPENLEEASSPRIFPGHLQRIWKNPRIMITVKRYEMTWSDGSDSITDALHNSGTFVSQNNRKVFASATPAQEIQIRVAQPGRMDFDPHLTAFGSGHLDRFHPHRIVNGPSHCRSATYHLRHSFKIDLVFHRLIQDSLEILRHNLRSFQTPIGQDFVIIIRLFLLWIGNMKQHGILWMKNENGSYWESFDVVQDSCWIL